jgi:tetratricopeptide (TPR) repeat protein
MWDMRTRSDYGLRIHRVKTIHKTLLLAGTLLLVSASLLFIVSRRSRSGNERKELLKYWEAGSFDQVYRVSSAELNSRPLDYFLLTLHGFSAYQLGIAQINHADTLKFIDEAVWSLRKARLLKNSQNDGRVYYVLGKAYYYKGAGYADMAVRYLEEARSLRYQAGDIPEYLGLAYAALRDYRSSVEAFSQALMPAEESPESPDAAFPSDVLLLSIARSYMALEETETARAYLLRCVEISRDTNTRTKARLLLGEVLSAAGDLAGAEIQYTAVLEEADDNAEAHYQLGELFSAGGDVTRARAEWRRAYRIDPAHPRARARLGI